MRIRFKRNILPVRQRGDTIVEVLFAMAIISAVLVASFIAAQRNTASVQTTQERAEALELADAQFENIKAISDNGGIDGAGAVNIYDDTFTTNFPTFCVYASDSTVHNTSDAECTIDRTGITTTDPAHSNNLAYTISVKEELDSNVDGSHRNEYPYVNVFGDPAAYIFTVTVTWDSLISSQPNTEVMSYRLYPPEQVSLTRPSQTGQDEAGGGLNGCSKPKGQCKPKGLEYSHWYRVTSSSIVSANVVSCTWSADKGGVPNGATTWSNTNPPPNDNLCTVPGKKVIEFTWPKTSPVTCITVHGTISFKLSNGSTFTPPPDKQPPSATVPYGPGSPPPCKKG